MKGVRCSWVDMLKRHQILSGAGDQKRLEMSLCVDHSTVSTWKAASEFIAAIGDRCEISNMAGFQPSHACEVIRHCRKLKLDLSGDDARDQIVSIVDEVENGKLTVQQLKRILRNRRAASNTNAHSGKVDDLAALAATGQRFGCVYADPPWPYDNQSTRAATSNHYATMTVNDITALPVRELAAEESHLWLWTTNGFLFDCPRIFDAWGFEFKSTFVWVKPKYGIGNYLRNAHELLLLGVRGGLIGNATDVKSWGEFGRGKHSSKPEEIRSTVIERISPPPYLELFGRRSASGWAVWGDEVAAGEIDHE